MTNYENIPSCKVLKRTGKHGFLSSSGNTETFCLRELIAGAGGNNEPLIFVTLRQLPSICRSLEHNTIDSHNKCIVLWQGNQVEFVHYVAHDGVIKWKHFPRYWPFVRKIHRSPVNSPHKGQWRGDLMFSLICAWMNGWVNNRKAGDLWHHTHYDVRVMSIPDT